MAKPPNLQEAIDEKGSPIKLLWKPGAKPWAPAMEQEFVGWREEQSANYDGVALSDLSHHMRNFFLKGPDATRLLMEHSANNYENFAIGQAKQFVPVTEQGHLVTDGILMRNAENDYTLSGTSPAISWILFHAQQGGYDVEYKDDDTNLPAAERVLSRFQIQGPDALDLVAKVFGGPLPETKFFHSTEVRHDGRSYRALRHGMTGQPGYEFIGTREDGKVLKESFLVAGEEFGLVQVGALAYATNGVESGWIPTPVPGIYSDPALKQFRQSLSGFSYEAKKPLHGSRFSEDIEDFYVSPYELGYGRSIAFNHDFVGRDALERAKDEVHRTKVTLVVDSDDVRETFGPDLDYFLTYGRYRIEVNDELVGMTYDTAHLARFGTILSLAIVEDEQAQPGTEVTLVYGEHPGPGTDPDADLGFARLRATVQPAPYNEYARTGYRTAKV